MRRPGRAERITSRLDAQYLGRQDHAISPYASCAVVPRRPAAHGGPPPCSHLLRRRARVHRNSPHEP